MAPSDTPQEHARKRRRSCSDSSSDYSPPSDINEILGPSRQQVFSSPYSTGEAQLSPNNRDGVSTASISVAEDDRYSPPEDIAELDNVRPSVDSPQSTLNVVGEEVEQDSCGAARSNDLGLPYRARPYDTSTGLQQLIEWLHSIAVRPHHLRPTKTSHEIRDELCGLECTYADLQNGLVFVATLVVAAQAFQSKLNASRPNGVTWGIPLMTIPWTALTEERVATMNPMVCRTGILQAIAAIHFREEDYSSLEEGELPDAD